MFTLSFQRNRQRRTGVATVEFAVIIPVFLLILMGTIETCTMIFLQQSLEIAAYEGARTSIVPETDLLDVKGAANNLLTARKIRGATVTIVPADFQSVPYGSFIRVEVSAACNNNTVFPLSFYGSKNLKGVAEFMKEFD